MAHFNASDVYFGSYARFVATDKKMGASLSGPDNAVGDVGSVEFQLDDDKRQQAWLKNPYGAFIGHLDPLMSHKLALYQAKGWEIRYVLSFTAFSDGGEACGYWGEAAVIAFAPRYTEQFEQLVAAFARRAGDGLRPDPDLNANAIEAIVADPDSWQPGAKVKMPQGSGRTAILKDHRTLHDKVLDQARRKNPGCYVVSWAFIIALVAFAAWILHSLGMF